MKSCDTVVLGVVYQGLEEFIQDYCSSINSQSDQDFDILIINDGFKGELNSLFAKSINVIELTEGLSPAEIRLIGINNAMQLGYKKLIFTDTDDFYSNNRIAESKKGLITADFVYNQLIPVDSKGEIIEGAPVFDLPSMISNIEELLDWNVLGLGNTAVNLESLEYLKLKDVVVAFDWWLFSYLLINGRKGIEIEAESYYRQHETNIVGSKNQLSEQSLDVGIKVKLLHYYALLSLVEGSYSLDITTELKTRINQIETLKTKIVDSEYKSEYICSKNKEVGDINKGWWSQVGPLKIKKKI